MEIKTKFNLGDIVWIIDVEKVEENCFATREEAQEECKKRNKGE